MVCGSCRKFGAALVFAACLLAVQTDAVAQDVAAKGGSVAVVNGIPVTEEELMKAAASDLEKLELQRLQANANLVRNRHEILESNLSRIVEGKVLAAEAAKQGMAVDALLQKELAGKVQEPTPQDVSAFYETNKARIGRDFQTVSGQILQYLKNENYNKAKGEYIEKLKREYQVSVSLAPLRMKVEAAGRPAKGPDSAPVTMIEFSDFQCPYCASLSKTLHRVVVDFGSEVRLVYRQFPLAQIHPYAEGAAEASLCAAEQGRFWDMHDLMFQNQSLLKEEDLKADAAKLNLDSANFDQCLNSHRYAGKINEDMREGATLGVSGTPAVFINGRMLTGAQSYEDLAKVIQEELGKKTE